MSPTKKQQTTAIIPAKDPAAPMPMSRSRGEKIPSMRREVGVAEAVVDGVRLDEDDAVAEADGDMDGDEEGEGEGEAEAETEAEGVADGDGRTREPQAAPVIPTALY